MAKRVMDVSLTIIALPIALPAVAIMAAILAVELRGNPFFRQKRVGIHGRPFTMLKLRTMHHPPPGQEDRFVIHDFETFIFDAPETPNPRLTRWGAFARKTSLDELPNLWNVLKGEMSLVGPRPELPEIVRQFPPEYHRRHDVLPGITGLAQVNGRSDLTYAQVASYDLQYVDDHSLMGDLRIIWRTLKLVPFGSGAR